MRFNTMPHYPTTRQGTRTTLGQLTLTLNTGSLIVSTNAQSLASNSDVPLRNPSRYLHKMGMGRTRAKAIATIIVEQQRIAGNIGPSNPRGLSWRLLHLSDPLKTSVAPTNSPIHLISIGQICVLLTSLALPDGHMQNPQM